jgi:hypothetical protein
MAAAKEGIVKRTGKFFREVRSEMRKVTWPDKERSYHIYHCGFGICCHCQWFYMDC